MDAFVVLVKGIGQRWTEGEVVTREEFDSDVVGPKCDNRGNVVGEEVGHDINRFLMIDAIRYATEHEKKEKKVVLRDSKKPSHHHDINKQTETISQLRNKVVELERQIATKNTTVLSTAPNKPVIEMLKDKEKKIGDLEAMVKDMMKEIKALKKES